jgi:hypothetical protein
MVVSSVRIPKRIPVAEIRSKLGDARAEAFLVSLFGPLAPPPIKLERESLAQMAALMANREDVPASVLPAVARAYFRESRARSSFLRWLRIQLEATESGNGANGLIVKSKPRVKPKGRRKRA